MMTNMTILALHLVAAAEGGGRRKRKTERMVEGKLPQW